MNKIVYLGFLLLLLINSTSCYKSKQFQIYIGNELSPNLKYLPIGTKVGENGKAFVCTSPPDNEMIKVYQDGKHLGGFQGGGNVLNFQSGVLRFEVENNQLFYLIVVDDNSKKSLLIHELSMIV